MTYVIALKEELLDMCPLCGYGRPSQREPMEYTEAYEQKYLAYPEYDINNIRLACLVGIGNNKKILDYGCGSGSFVRAARAAGHEAYGFDVNSFTSDIRPPAYFAPEIVTAWDSFEHLTDIQQTIFFATAKSAKHIVVSLPDFESAGDIEQWRHYRPKEHLHYYTQKSLTVRFDREGFSPIFAHHGEDAVRKAPWKNNILTMGFVRYE